MQITSFWPGDDIFSSPFFCWIWYFDLNPAEIQAHPAHFCVVVTGVLPEERICKLHNVDFSPLHFVVGIDILTWIRLKFQHILPPISCFVTEVLPENLNIGDDSEKHVLEDSVWCFHDRPADQPSDRPNERPNDMNALGDVGWNSVYCMTGDHLGFQHKCNSS